MHIMLKTMQAAVFHGANNLRVEEVKRPEPGPGEVLLRVARCGICGTDSHIVRGRFPAPNLPLIIGHEFAGTVAAVGAGVVDVKEGDRATADINIACGRCWYCRHNSKLFCPNVRQLGVHSAGGMAEYVAVPAANLYTLPSTMSFDHAAFIEPLACAIHGQKRIGVGIGETVLVIGGGPMGLAHIAMSKLRGAGMVAVSELNALRRDRAKAVGADIAVDPTADGIEEFLAQTNDRGADVVIEAVGSPATYTQAFRLVRRGGRILAYGAAPPEAEIPVKPFDIYAKELSIVGSYAGTYETWPEAIELISGGRFDPSKIVDSVQPLSNVAGAIESMERDKSVVKVQVEIA
jgi:2-desacetyl-2-hydroxyethyl bacteriochlorophyllide A dehydrogenase